LFGFFTVMGLRAFFYGVAVLLGRAGKMIILGKVLAAPATWETSEVAVRPLMAFALGVRG
jgi:hypothetical protein